MKSTLFISTIVLCLIFIVGCGPSEEAPQVFLAQTQTATATNTHSPEPTFTPILTNTPTPTPTSTHTLTPSSTPDTRVITISPEKVLLVVEDLPSDPEYIINGGYPFQLSPEDRTSVNLDWID